MSNQYAGKCTNCGQRVAPREGAAIKVSGVWEVKHFSCPEPAADAFDAWQAAQGFARTVQIDGDEVVVQACSGDVHGPGDDECRGALCVQPMPRAERGFSGLTPAQIIVQSAACHPDWTVRHHAEYLRNEEGVTLPEARVAAVLEANVEAVARLRAGAR